MPSATALPKPEWLTNNLDYGYQGQTPADQIGDGQGIANWGTSQGDIKPAYPVQQNSASGDGTGRLLGFLAASPYQIGRFRRRSIGRANG